MPSPAAVVACLKLVELRAAVDPLTGQIIEDPMSAGASPADLAGLEWALRCGEHWGVPVTALTAGPARAEIVLRAALAAGCHTALRVDLEASAPSDEVAHALAVGVAGAISRAGADGGAVVFCGDASVDRGSGSVPAFVAAYLGVAQALGLVHIEVGLAGADGEALAVERRLDRERRERLTAEPPCVLSVEGSTARLRRAPLASTLSAPTVAIDVIRLPAAGPLSPPVVTSTGVEPYRPRARAVPPPIGSHARDRILELTGALAERPPARKLVLDPEQAADELLLALAAWGELPEPIADRLLVRHASAPPPPTIPETSPA